MAVPISDSEDEQIEDPNVEIEVILFFRKCSTFNEVIETQLNFKGEVETDVDWDEDLTDKNSDKYKDAEAQLEKDLKKIVEADDSIEEAEMTECDFEPVSDGRKRREGKEFENLVPFCGSQL